jgi:hypothetical protein
MRLTMTSLAPRRLQGTTAGLLVVCVLTFGCSSSRETPAPAGSERLWGEMTPIVSVKELMRDMLDPLADNIFDAVGIYTDGNGSIERVPVTDEDWAKIRLGGVAMAEGAYLLKVRRPFAPPGDNNTPGGVELTPAQISEKVEADPVEWNARIEALRNVGLQVLDIVNKKDIQQLWDASDNLDQACEGCHRSYWYPGETPEYYRDLDSRLLGRSKGEADPARNAPASK